MEGIAVAKKTRNLWKRGGVWYFRKILKGKMICFSLETVVKTEALQLRTKIQEFYLSKGFYPYSLKSFDTHGEASIPEFGELAVKWFELKRRSLKKASRRDYRYSLNNYILPRFGNIPVNQISYLDMEMFIAGLDKKNKRIANLLIPMRNVFKLAMKAGYIEKNPMELLDPIKPEKPDIDPFTFDEAQAIIETINPFYRNFAQVLFFTGMRFSEAAALRWKYVDFNLGVIKIREALVEGEFDRPKTESSRRDIKMLPMVEQALRDQRKTTWGRADFVFLNMSGRNIKPTPFNQKIWKKACSLAGVPYKPVKHTRSTFITMMLDAGEHVGWVARQVGHSSFQMIYQNYYSYIRNYQAEDGAKFMERVYRTKQKKTGKTASKKVAAPGVKSVST